MRVKSVGDDERPNKLYVSNIGPDPGDRRAAGSGRSTSVYGNRRRASSPSNVNRKTGNRNDRTAGRSRRPRTGSAENYRTIHHPPRGRRIYVIEPKRRKSYLGPYRPRGKGIRGADRHVTVVSSSARHHLRHQDHGSAYEYRPCRPAAAAPTPVPRTCQTRTQTSYVVH